MKHALFGVLLAAAGCHHGAAPAPAPDHTAEVKPAPKEMHENMPPELAKFHELLAPRWHAEKGPERTKDTCGAVADFVASADTLAKMTPPAGVDAAKWQASTQTLAASVANLKAKCDGGAQDTVQFEDAFVGVHISFHGVLAAVTGEVEPEHEEDKE